MNMESSAHEWRIVRTSSGVFVGHVCFKCGFRLGDWRGYVEYPDLENPPQKVVDAMVGKCLSPFEG